MIKPRPEAPAGEETPAATTPETAEPKAAEPVKNWQYWVNSLKADLPLARGACASLKSDWEAAVTEAAFKKALEKFGGKEIAWRKA
ncbi:MAG: hypothetical protein J0L53_07185 [Spirochaetes bacterium]|nr:hypothetical protein [Spirochaetota bacterium]